MAPISILNPLARLGMIKLTFKFFNMFFDFFFIPFIPMQQKRRPSPFFLDLPRFLQVIADFKSGTPPGDMIRTVFHSRWAAGVKPRTKGLLLGQVN